MMKKIAFVVLIVTFFVSCEERNIDPEKKTRTDCTIPATIINLNGLDGCGFVFRLEDGDILQSYSYVSCSAENVMTLVDPLKDFDMVDGKRVLIEYDSVNAASACQAGQMVLITCITDAPATSGQE
jgi:hypothetical protein